MSYIKHQMIERRDINLSITKEELLTKILATYQIENLSQDLIKQLKVSFSSDTLNIKGVFESVLTDITPTYTDENPSAVVDPLAKNFFYLKSKNLGPDMKRILSEVLGVDRMHICASPEILSLTRQQAEDLDECLVRIPNNAKVYGLNEFGHISSAFGSMYTEFNNKYFVPDPSWARAIPDHEYYGRLYDNGWSISKMDGTKTAAGVRKVVRHKSGLSDKEMYESLGGVHISGADFVKDQANQR